LTIINALRNANESPSLSKVLASIASKVPNLPPLSNADVETARIREVIPQELFLVQEGDTIDARPAHVKQDDLSSVLAILPEASILHLACHAHQDRDDPLNSGFDLSQGRLTAGQLMEARSPNAQLAYLSACESAAADENQPDEAINLAATMLFVGFKSVIATMW
jgi:CHAT domain-containing protein